MEDVSLVRSYPMNLQAPWERAGPIVDIIMGVDNTGPQPEIMLQGRFIYSCLFVGFNFLIFFPLYRFLTTSWQFLCREKPVSISRILKASLLVKKAGPQVSQIWQVSLPNTVAVGEAVRTEWVMEDSQGGRREGIHQPKGRRVEEKWRQIWWGWTWDNYYVSTQARFWDWKWVAFVFIEEQ